MLYNLLFGFYEKTTDFIKSKINSYFETKPEKGLVEKNVFLFGEHLFFFGLGMFYFGQEDWLYDLTLIWDPKISLSVFVYYYLYITRYVVQTKQLSINDKEYLTYMAHHLSTISLLCFSFSRHSRIGIMIGILHDIVDLFLLPAKICHRYYETRNIELLNKLSYLMFLIFVPVYFITRIYGNGAIVLYLYETKFFSSLTENYWYTIKFHPDTFLCFFLLHVNWIIQMVWQVMIVKFLYSITTGQDAIDEKNQSYFKKKK